jgi:hypothetical protein
LQTSRALKKHKVLWLEKIVDYERLTLGLRYRIQGRFVN